MSRPRAAIAIGLLLASLLGPLVPATRAAFEAEMEAFAAQDAANPPPPGVFVFIGSSSVRMWPDIGTAFPNHPVLNRGFGGSEMSHALEHFDKLVTPYQPALIVLYEGDNDLVSKTPAAVFADYKAFTDRLALEFPDTDVVILSVKPSPSRAHLMAAQRDLNARLAELCETSPRLRFIDVFTPMLNAQGQPRPELFQSDMLHMNAAGYAIWNSLVGPALDAAPFVPSPVVFQTEPADVTVEAHRPAVFTVTARGSRPFTIQWRRDGEPIPGANRLRYEIPAAGPELDGAAFSVTVANAFSEATSRAALLRVTPDVTPPRPVSAAGDGGAALRLAFDERLDPASAENPANYRVAGGPAVVAAALTEDGQTVVLALSAIPAGTVLVQISGLTDLSGNAIAPGASIEAAIPAFDPRPVLIDFGGASTTNKGAANGDSENVWNNVTAGIGATSDASLSNLKNTGGEDTGAGLLMVSRFNGVNENGTTAATSGFPLNATRDSLYGNTEAFGGLSDIFPEFKLTGLKPGISYTFVFYASRTGVSDNRTTRYTVTGETTAFADLNAANNIDKTATVAAIRPSASGDVTIRLTPAPANNNANHFTYLGVLKIIPEPPDVRTAPVLQNPVIVDGNIRLDWTGEGQLEWSASPEGPWNAVTPAPSPPWTEPLETGARRFYRIRY